MIAPLILSLSLLSSRCPTIAMEVGGGGSMTITGSVSGYDCDLVVLCPNKKALVWAKFSGKADSAALCRRYAP